CDNKAFSKFAKKNVGIPEQIEFSIRYYTQKMGIKKFILYFQSFTNTYADIKTLKAKYDIARKFPQIAGISISTRPDCIDEEKIKLIASYQKDYLVWIEYGLQSTDNDVLMAFNRKHTYEDFLSALELTRRYKINTGIHLIIGLAFALNKTVDDVQKVASLDIQGIKFHLLHVLKDTALDKLYTENKVRLLTEDEYIKAVCDFLERIPENIVILRLISNANPNYFIAPLWMNKKSEVIAKIKEEFRKRGTHQGCACEKNEKISE
ncbi:MAG: TIGR01212 family radical SAM protein, partial [Candidatus Omnitrophota bacterium]